MRGAGPGQSRTLLKKDVVSQMNTKSLLTRIAVPVLSLGLLGGIGATLATSASASTLPAATMASATHATTVRGITFQGHVEDTTDHATSVTDPVYGPVWSYDDMSRSLAATRDATDSGLWHVKLSSTGVYHAFADPRQDNVAYHGSGLMAGWVTYDVRSVTAPSQAHLPLTVPSTMHSTDIIAKWFGSPDGFTVTTLHYDFNYYGLPGGTYNQQG